MANYYDQPAQASFMNTYVPIPFDELYKLGASAKADVEKATTDLSQNLQKWSEFKSPSARDTQRYYDLTIGKLRGTIEDLASNPDLLKSAEGRYRLQSQLNNLDYGTLSQIKQSAENLQTRTKAVAEMQAQGKYNKDWDTIDINNWDTATSGVMSELAPLEYQSVRQLSDPYYSKLKPGRLGTKRDKTTGLYYDYTGNTIQDLEAVVNTNYNDMANTPQGKMYINQNLRTMGIDPNTATPEQLKVANDMFRKQIVDSNMYKTIAQQGELNMGMLQLTLANIKADAANARRKPDDKGGNQTLRSLFLDSAGKKVESNLMSKVAPSAYVTTDASGKSTVQYTSPYLDYLRENAQKYKNNPVVVKGYQNAVKNMNRMQRYINEANKAMLEYEQTGSSEAAAKAIQFNNAANQEQNALTSRATKFMINDSFKRGSGNKDFGTPMGTKQFLNGVKNVIDNMSFEVTDDTSKKILFQNLSNGKIELNTKGGGPKDGYYFMDSGKFILPETVVELSLGKKGRITRRDKLFTSSSKEFPLRELIETGQFTDIQAIPTNQYISMSTGDGVQFGAKTKLRIPVQQVQDLLGTGWMSSSVANNALLSMIGMVGSQESSKSAVKRLFGGREVEEKIDENTSVPYYEIDAILPLPKNDSEVWQTLNQMYQGSKGVGGSSQAKETYQHSSDEVSDY